ncbi:methionine/alanine import family NSS transporter small subunit [Specibacter sp. NPDC078709]
MSTPAIIMMIIALLTIGGGLSLAIWNLSRHPEDEDQLPEEMPHEL